MIDRSQIFVSQIFRETDFTTISVVNFLQDYRYLIIFKIFERGFQ